MFAKKIYWAVRASLHWSKALEASSHGKHAEALKHIEKMENLLPLPIEDSLLKGYLFYAVGKDKECFDLLTITERKLCNSKKHNESEKRYLKCYATLWKNYALEALIKRGEHSSNLDSPVRIDYKEVDLKKVPKHMKRNYPLRCHPDWIE